MKNLEKTTQNPKKMLKIFPDYTDNFLVVSFLIYSYNTVVALLKVIWSLCGS